MNPSRTIVLALLLFALVTGLVACGGEPSPAPADTAAPVASDMPAPTATPTTVPPTDTPEPTAAAPQVTELDLQDLATPSDLSSYRSNVTMTTSGTQAGETVEGRLEVLMEYTSEPLVQHLRMSGEGAGMAEVESMGTVEMYQLEDTTYIQFGDQWLSVPTTEEITANMGVIKPEDLLEDTCGWQQQADTEYEGIEAYRWTLATEDAQACMTEDMMEGLGEISEATGELYVAKEGNYIIHMEMALTGSELNASLGGGEQVLDDGRMEVTFDLRDVNEPFTIEVPEEALTSGALPEDIPVPDDAEDVTNAFGMITYNTAQSPAEMSDYYQAQMPANGWTEVSTEETEGMFALEYSKEGRTANLIINTDADSGMTEVVIMIAEPES